MMGSTRPTKQPSVAVKFGSVTLQGGPAIVALVAMLLVIVAAIYASHPSLRMLLSGAIWIAFIIYFVLDHEIDSINRWECLTLVDNRDLDLTGEFQPRIS